jgi:hypothetical protein
LTHLFVAGIVPLTMNDRSTHNSNQGQAHRFKRNKRPTLGETVREARDVPLRQLSERAQLSPAQLSRIETEQVSQPPVDTLVRIGHALRRSIMPLLVLAGYLDGAEARTRLLELIEARRDSGEFADDAERIREEIQTRDQLLGELRRAEQSGKTWLERADAAEHRRRDVEAAYAHNRQLQAQLEREYGELDAVDAKLDAAREDRAAAAGAVRDLEHLIAATEKELAVAVREGKSAAEAAGELHRRVEQVAALDDPLLDLARRLFLGGKASMELALWPKWGRSENDTLRRAYQTAIGAWNRGHIDAAPALDTDRFARAVDALQHRLDRLHELGRRDSGELERLAGAVAEAAAKSQQAVEQMAGAEALRHQVHELEHQLRKLGSAPDAAELAAVQRRWDRITPQRRKRVLEFIDDQYSLSIQEQLEQLKGGEQASGATKSERQVENKPT